MALVIEDLGKRQRRRLKSILSATEKEGARLQFWARTGALAAIAAVILTVFKWDAAMVYVLSALSVFFLTGFFSYRLALAGRRKMPVGLILGIVDIALLTLLMIIPNPFIGFDPPPAMALREGGFKYLLIFICLGALSLSVRYAVYLGAAAAISWSLGVIWIATRPGSIVPNLLHQQLDYSQWMRLYLDPNFVNVTEQVINVALLVIVAGIIGTVVLRARNLADEYTKAERARYNLSRHFSPNVVDELATNDEPFGPIRRQDIAVVFADIVGFTSYTEEHPPEQVFELLREFHRRMEAVIFDHKGTVDNYIGDCIMATFGVPTPAFDDAARALTATRAMIAAINAWNIERAAAGQAPVDIRVGCQFGQVVLGAIGSERSLSIAVVGDTCNVASRLQTLCRDLGADICVGAAVIDNAIAAGDHGAAKAFVNHGPVALRGREELVDVWYVPNRDAKTV